MKIKIDRFTQRGTNLAIRCPHCGHFGTFESLNCEISINTTDGSPMYYVGVKRCPNTNCKGQLYYVKDIAKGQIIETCPSETIPFDKENIPAKILNAFEESIKCHSNSCFIASAIMIRKTLEEICFDRGATGKNLKDRLKDLGTKILIPKELIGGMDDLRLLGNDAAHIEATTFSEIGKEEIEISINFAKEILKAVYQYEYLLDKLRKLKEKKNNEV